MWTLREDFFVAEVLRRPLPRPPCDFRYPISQYRVLHLLTVNGYPAATAVLEAGVADVPFTLPIKHKPAAHVLSAEKFLHRHRFSL
ncbi:MAG: hypothetical protein KatS3mg109_1249 [Pirellulaceae bacterium]|nr:MAG: hypothetical protein KatS3mg109_1249 [Pirellulaceae bacterium]